MSALRIDPRHVCRRLTAIRSCRRGEAVVEFALMLPLLMIVFAGAMEMGRVLVQAAVLEKSLRGGVLFAARSPYPLSTETRRRAINLVRTGTADADAPPLLPGLAADAGSVDLSVRSYVIDGTAMPVIHISARVPYRPMLEGLLAPLGLDGFVLEFDHEQPHIGG